MGIVLKEPTLVWQIEQLASQSTRPVEQVLEMAVRTYLDERECDAIHIETEAFWAMHDELLSKFTGQYVAMFHGDVIDYGPDASILEQRVRERLGLLPVLIAPVEPGPRRDLRWRGGRIEAAR
ncbi:MAG: hypothetical protein CVU38_11385 [Chloroflexi bacterium HGW-Chloroflexi-1]|nr:MAG: hypothetical protein CVU38_11385 [Chloroflexi bacterium HGW-Chloroflexi-1]